MRFKKGLALGTYDLFHVGHLHFLEKAAGMCTVLNVAVDCDDYVLHYKHHLPVIGENDRAAILKALKCVHDVVIHRFDWGPDNWISMGIDVVFIGSNWEDNPDWRKTDTYLQMHHVSVVYIQPMEGVSTTQIVSKIQGLR